MNNAPVVSRRSFLGTTALAAAGVAASRSLLAQAPAQPASSAALHPVAARLLADFGRPNSKFAGVQIGVIAPYSFGNGSAEDLLKYCVALGINAVELQNGPVEQFVGAAGGGGRGGGGVNIPGATPAQTAAVAAVTAALAPLNDRVTTARAQLLQASLKVPASRDEIAVRTKAVADAELELAIARADQTAKLQASADKLSPQQLPNFIAANGGPAVPGGRGGRGGGAGAAGAPPTLTVSTDPLLPWMTPATLTKVAELRKMYNDAGVSIYGFKRGSATQSDVQLDYNFLMAQVLGADHITLELPGNPLETERLGAFGKKHNIRVGYHTHAQGSMTAFDEAIRQSTHNALNVDAGHYQAANSSSVIPLLKKHEGKVASIHLKDRKNNNGDNMMWGQGDTNIVEILQTIRNEKWTFPATIEFEYGGQMPAGSNRLVEIGRCRSYCAAALIA